MIKANHSQLAHRVFSAYLAHSFRRHFASLQVLGEIPLLDSKQPVLVLPNHSTWWDGFFFYWLNKSLWARRPFLMMLEAQLSKNSFFSRVGAYSIDPASAAENRRSLQYTIEKLESTPPPVVCMFPQGELLPNGTRPLVYKPGLQLILRRFSAPLQIVQLAVRCEFTADQRPHAFFQFGEPHVVEENQPDLDLARLAIQHERLLDELGKRIAGREQGKYIFHGKKSINDAYVQLRQRFGLMNRTLDEKPPGGTA